MSKGRPTEGPSNNLINTKDILFIWRLFVQNIFIILFVPLVAYFVGYVYTYRLQYKYGAKVQLLLKSGETYDYQDQIYKGLGAYEMYMDVQNQMRILRSKNLIGEVVDKIDANVSYYIVGRVQKREVFDALPFKCEANVFNPAINEIPIEVEILDVDSYKLSYSLNGEEKELTGKFDEELYSSDLSLVMTQAFSINEANIDVIKSSNYEIMLHSRNYLIGKYKGAMSIENLEGTSILEVKVVDELTPRATAFLDTLTYVYIDYSKRQQLEVNQNTLDNIQKQIDTITDFIEEKEIELLTYKDSTSILNPEKEESEYFTKYFESLKLERELLKQKNSLIALKSYLSNADKTEHLLPPSFYIEKDDVYLGQAIAKIREFQLDLEILKTSYKADNPKIEERKRQINMLKGDILKYIENLFGALDFEIDRVRNEISGFRGSIKNLPQTEQGIQNIQRELDVNNKMFVFLLEKKTNTLIARAGIIPQVQIVESTTSLGVVEPDKSKIIRLFALAGLFIGLLIAFVRKVFFERITSVSELKDVTSLTVLGGVPHLKDASGDPLVVLNNPKSNVTESFRSIRSNLLFLGESTENKAKRIMVSSFFPQEGKTLVTSNISTLIARGDKKVLLIDFDLHRPKIHKSFKLDNAKGVSSYVIGKASLDDIIQKNVAENLDIISAGPIAPNPSEIVMREKVKALFKEAEGKYDYIVVDTAPFGLLNDSLELAKIMDVFMIIFNTKYSRRRGIQNIEEMLKNYDVDSIGVVLNNIKMKRLQYYYAKYTYKYTYGYGYNYGYGYGYSQEYGSDYEETKDPKDL